MSDAANNAVDITKETEQKLEDLKISGDKADNSEERIRRRRLPNSERIRLWEDEQKNKVVVETGIKGTVKWYSVLGRYGFIAREDGGKDVFVHQTAIAKSITNKFYLRTLADNEEVLFDLVEGAKGPEAGNVTGPNGENVQGSRFRHLLLSRFRRNRKSRNNADDNAKSDEKNASGEKPAAQPKKAKKQHKNRRNGKPNKASGDAPAEQKSENSGEKQDEDLAAAARRKIIDEPEHTNIDRCGSALGEATLGAQAVDAQI
ncbi:unnamed protein product [Caenorhabditis bovis]|uniref:CSD domain-containing protein n=1 Tax=Caenorhabditis bovis TaxID=2654633 RepID=A0A8S1F4P2_9PELO|nr:unnamed protein product [Caenorhabditis bovis]